MTFFRHPASSVESSEAHIEFLIKPLSGLQQLTLSPLAGDGSFLTIKCNPKTFPKLSFYIEYI